MIAGSAISSIGISWLARAMTPEVPRIAVIARMIGTEAATSAPKVSARMISVIPSDFICEAPSSSLAAASSSLRHRRVAELLDGQAGVTLRGVLGRGQHGLDALERLLGVALDVELHERGAAVLGDASARTRW